MGHNNDIHCLFSKNAPSRWSMVVMDAQLVAKHFDLVPGKDLVNSLAN